MNGHYGAAAALVAAMCLAPVAGAQTADEIAFVDLYLKRDGTLMLDAPTASEDAVFTFGLTGNEIAFESVAFGEPRLFVGEGTLRLTLGTEVSVLGQLSGTLRVAGAPVATSETETLLVDLRQNDVALRFTDLDFMVEAGETLSLAIRLAPVVEGILPGLPVNLVDVLVEMRYDSVAHPGGLHLAVDASSLGLPPVTPPTGPGALPPGNDTGNGPGQGGEPLVQTAGPVPIPPLVLLAGVATSATVAVAGLALRGRIQP